MFRAMLVEDSPSFRNAFRLYLRSEFPSMEIIEAADGLRVLENIDFHSPNLIFMDINLPGENGLELTKKIKSYHTDIIIIILTNHDLPEYREAAIRYKADYFFPKSSISTDNISALVKTIFLELGFNVDGSDCGMVNM